MTTLVIIPTHNHCDTLAGAIESVLAQSVSDWCLVVIGDGAPARTHTIVNAYAARDPRIHWYPMPKSPGKGEVYRDAAIRRHKSRYVAYLSDDDIWAPWHLAALLPHLDSSDFVHSPYIDVTQEGKVRGRLFNIASPFLRSRMLNHLDWACGLSFVAHRTESYFQLAEGWETAPPQHGSDSFMWNKFVAHAGLRMVTHPEPTVLHFADPTWRVHSPEKRLDEQRRWLRLLNKSGMRLHLRLLVSYQDLLLSELEANAALVEPLADYLSNRKIEIANMNSQPTITLDYIYWPLSNFQINQIKQALQMMNLSQRKLELVNSCINNPDACAEPATRAQLVLELRESLPSSVARDAFADANQIWPEIIGLRLLLAQRLEFLGNHAEAESLYRKILNEDPDNSAAWSCLLQYIASAGDARNAGKTIMDARKAGVSRSLLFETLGHLDMKRGRPLAASSNFRRATQLSPDEGKLYAHLADAYVQAKRLSEAEKAVRRALELAPNQPVIQYAACLTYDAIARSREARYHAQTLLKLAQGDAYFSYFASLILEKNLDNP